MKLKISILIAGIALTMASCLKNEIEYDTDNLEYRTWEFAAPIAKVHIPFYESMRKYLIDSLKIDDELVYIEYFFHERIIWNKEIEITVEKPVNESINLETEAKPAGDSKFRAKRDVPIHLIISGDKDSFVTNTEFSGGTFSFSFTIPPGIEFCDIDITIPQLRKNHETNLPATPFMLILRDVEPGTYEIDKKSLENYFIDTGGEQELELTCIVELTGESMSGNLDFTFALEDMEFDYLGGYFGKVTSSMKNSVNFDFFKDLDIIGDFGVKGITMKTEVNNYVGMPVLIEIKEVSLAGNNGAENQLNAETIKIEVESATNEDNIIPGKVLNPEPVFFDIEYDFTKDNYPTSIEFDIVASSNYDKNGDKENFIVAGNKTADVDVTIIVPFDAVKLTYTRTDTVAFDYRDFINNDETLSKSIDYFALTLRVDNDLPFDVGIAAFATDNDGNFVESIVENKKVSAKKSGQVIKIEIDKKQLDQFWKAAIKNIVLISTANTQKEDYTQISGYDSLDIAISLSFKSNIPSNIF